MMFPYASIDYTVAVNIALSLAIDIVLFPIL